MEKSILIIEDKRATFNYLKKWLSDHNYTVLPESFDEMRDAIDPRKPGNICDYAISQIETKYKDIRLVLCDIQLGTDEYCGNKVVKGIREYEKINSSYISLLPIIAITEYTQRQQGILDAGADFSIEKDRFYNKIIIDSLGKRKKNTQKVKEKDIIKFKNEQNVVLAIIETQIDKFDKNIKKLNIIKDDKRVFIVHGHDSEAIKKVNSMLTDMGFEAIVLRKEPSGGRSIIDKIEDESKKCCFAIILYTKCDEGRLKGSEELKDRARQNVVFEHGYMWSMMGRKRVCALVEKGIEMPNDLSGIVYIPDDKTNDAWCKDVVKEMRYAGLDADESKINNHNKDSNNPEST